jgi:predicted nucleotidyltransferase
MRLSTDQIQAIRQAATAAFGQGTAVWLFGSRVDDAKKGGDIDLLVCPQAPAYGHAAQATPTTNATNTAKPQPAFMQKVKMLTLLEQALGERKIDIVVEHPQDQRPIVEVAHTTGIRLQ